MCNVINMSMYQECRVFFSFVLLIFFFLHSVFAHSKEKRGASKNEKKTYKNKLSFTRMLKQNKTMEIN